MNRRYAWLTAGIVVVVMTVAIAASNLRDIYLAQKDFVVGSLLSLAGFAFGKALDRSKQERDQWLQSAGAFDNLAKLETHLRSADDRLTEHYWTFTAPNEILTAAHEDLTTAATYADRLRHALGVDLGDDEWKVSAELRVKLDAIRRDMREAINRLIISRARLEVELPVEQFRELWDVYDVLTTDLLKANRNLDGLSREHVAFPPAEQARRAADYLSAATRRAAEIRTRLEGRSTGIPGTFEIMESDLAAALRGLDDLKFEGVKLPAPVQRPAPAPASG